MPAALYNAGPSEPQRFGLRFFALLVLASILAWLVSLPDRLGFAQRFLAGSGTWLADLVGGGGRVNGDQITVSTLSLDINYEAPASTWCSFCACSSSRTGELALARQVRSSGWSR